MKFTRAKHGLRGWHGHDGTGKSKELRGMLDRDFYTLSLCYASATALFHPCHHCPCQCPCHHPRHLALPPLRTESERKPERNTRGNMRGNVMSVFPRRQSITVPMTNLTVADRGAPNDPTHGRNSRPKSDHGPDNRTDLLISPPLIANHR